MNTHNLLLQHILGTLTAPGTTETALTMADSSTILDRYGRAYLMDVWAKVQGAGYLKITSPKLHDDTDALKLRTIAARAYTLLPIPVLQELYPQDILSLKGTGSATAGDVEDFAMQVMYTNPGQAGGRFITFRELVDNLRYVKTLEFAVTAATAAGYGGTLALSGAVNYNLRGNTDYALLGFSTSVLQCSIVMYGPDTGNMKLGVPGDLDREKTKDFFVNAARAHGMPLIPVLNTSNYAATYIQTVNDENAASPVVTMHLAELRK